MPQTWVIPGSKTGLIKDVIPSMPGVQIDRGLYSTFDVTAMWLHGNADFWMPVYVATGESLDPFVITFREPIWGIDIKCTLPKGKPGKVRLLAYLDTDKYPESPTIADSTAIPVEAPNFDLKLGAQSPIGDNPRIVRIVLFREDESDPNTPAPNQDVIFGTTGWQAEG